MSNCKSIVVLMIDMIEKNYCYLLIKYLISYYLFILYTFDSFIFYLLNPDFFFKKKTKLN